MKNLDKKHWYIIGIWFIVNLLQSAFTGLHSDESYYWMYSQNLDWGYFDHPPMAALWIYLGHLILPGELGVRIFMVLLSTVTFALILNELNERKDHFFLVIFVLSFPLVHTHIAGFIALPDVPLLFFTFLFLLLYRKFLVKPDAVTAILLGMVAGFMIYSKYHAFLVIGFTVLSNLKLLRNKFFWVAAGVAILTLVPHIYWQIDHGFPTFRYHLVERAKPFRIKHITDNLLNQLAMAGPLTGVIVFWKLSKFRIKNAFDRMLVFNIIGFYTLLFILSFKNRIEAHWTAAITPMIMMIAYPLVKHDEIIRKWFKRLAVPVIFLMLLYRGYLALDVIPNVGHLKITFYNREASAIEIKNMANGKKVGFFDNYAAISNYIFYTGDSAVLFSTPGYRFCQYDLWDDEKYANGEAVFAIQSKHLNPPNLYKAATGETKGYIEVEEFQSLQGLIPELIKQERTAEGFRFEIKLINEGASPVFTDHVSEPVLCLMQNHVEASVVVLQSEQLKINPGQTTAYVIDVDKHIIDPEIPVTVYTRTKENIRGGLISFKLE
jgi:hypothetical protein